MSENNLTQNDILYMETKSIFVQLIRSMPNIADKRPINLPAIAEKAATTKDAVLVRKGIKVKEMLRELDIYDMGLARLSHDEEHTTYVAYLTYMGTSHGLAILNCL